MSDEIYPIIEPDGEEIFYQNAWRTEEPQTLGDVECFNFNAQPNEIENLIVMKLTGNQLLEMLSALYIGAEFTYPEKYLEVIRPLLAATACPPILEEQECYEYPSYASFMRYTPVNPYIEPDLVPDGYETQPFLVNGENGNDIPNYDHFDVIVPSSAITLDINWFSSISGQLPTIEILVQGAGKAFLKMLTTAGGGLAVITLDNPPDLLDIIAGIVTSGENIIDLNQDLVSLPPETAQELIYEVDIVGSGLHTIYIVFLPILDDSFIPIRFGGGFRGVQLCDFVEIPEMGITNLRFIDCNLEQLENGEWTIVSGWEDWLTCVPSGGGGGGVAGLKASVYSFELPANQDTTSTSLVQAAGTVQSHQFTYENALIFAECQLSNTNAGANAFFQIRIGSDIPDGNVVNRIGGNAGEILYTSGNFADINTASPLDINLYFRASANTARIGTGSRLQYTILEYDTAEDLEAMFVQDIQYSGGILQKKISGSWFNVVDIAALIAPAQTTANNAAAAAAAAQSTANSAQSTANGAVSVNNTQNTRLNNLELSVSLLESTTEAQQIQIDALETNSSIQAAAISVLDGRLDNLEDDVEANTEAIETLSSGGVWAELQDLTANDGGWEYFGAGAYIPSEGWRSDGGGLEIEQTTYELTENQITHVEATVIFDSTPSSDLTWSINGGDAGRINFEGLGNESKGWLRVGNTINTGFNLDFAPEGVYTLVALRFLGRGTVNPFE